MLCGLHDLLLGPGGAAPKPAAKSSSNVRGRAQAPRRAPASRARATPRALARWSPRPPRAARARGRRAARGGRRRRRAGGSFRGSPAGAEEGARAEVSEAFDGHAHHLAHAVLDEPRPTMGLLDDVRLIGSLEELVDL